MASSVKGMTIDIGGDTSKLQAALKQLNKPIQSVQRELNGLNSSLKIDPGNTTLLTNKQQLLAKQITDTQTKIATLKQAISGLNDIQAKNGSLTEEQQEEYRRLTSELAKAEINLKSLKKEYSDFGSVAKQKMMAVGEKLKEVGGKIEDVGRKVSVVSAAVGGLLLNGVKYTADLQKIQAGLKVATGSAEEAERIMAQIKKDAASTPFDVKGLAQANQLLLSTGMDAESSRKTILALGDAVAASGGGNDELQRMAYNLQQVKNLGEASSVDIKQFGMAGIDIYGILADYLGVTKEEAAEMKVTFEDLQGALLNASQSGGKYFKGMEEQSQTLNGSVSNLKDTFNEFTATLAVALVPIIQKATQFLKGLMDRYNQLSPEMQEIISKIAIAVAVAGPLLIIIGKVVSGVGSLIQVLSLFANPVGLVILAIAAVVTALVVLYNKCEWFRNGVNAIVSGVVNFVTNAITTIGNFFTVTIPGWIDTVKMILDNLPYYIGYLIGMIIAKLYEFGNNLMNFANTRIPEFIERVKTFFRELPQKILVALIESLYNLGKWIEDMKSKARTGIPELINNIVNYFKDLPNKLKEIGIQAIAGLFEGIKSKFEALRSTITNIANGIRDGFRSALDIHSPSRVMRDEIGKNIVLGIQEGMERNMKGMFGGVQSKLGMEIGGFGATMPVAGSQTNNISIVVNAQELNQASLEQAFNYVNRRFGAAI